MLLEAMITGKSDGQIEKQESRGQSSLVNSDTLPTKMDDLDRVILEKAGVVFGDVVKGDEIFQYAELPEGWRKNPTDHSMWSELLDEKGRKRAGIFYKAAFYDRNAYLHCEHRYSYRNDYDHEKANNEIVVLVTDCGKTIHTTKALPLPERERYNVTDIAYAAANEWLNENFPNWTDAGAYWETDNRRQNDK